MKIISNKKHLIKFIKNEKNLGFVPTMGGIHIGHISLIEKSISQSSKTIVSVFINRPQFSNKKDFKRYPRNLKNDILWLKKLKIDYLYLPSNNQIYPVGQNKKIKINKFASKLCGKFRPGHFEAVIDVIDRFIKIIRPKNIYLGQKDMQQLKIVEDFANKNYPGINIIGCKTIREKNGIAYSSRNFLLSKKQKLTASKIYRILNKNKKKIISKKISLHRIKNRVLKMGVSKIDYIEILNINRIIKPYKLNYKFRIFIAYYLNAVRLIDNI